MDRSASAQAEPRTHLALRLPQPRDELLLLVGGGASLASDPTKRLRRHTAHCRRHCARLLSVAGVGGCIVTGLLLVVGIAMSAARGTVAYIGSVEGNDSTQLEATGGAARAHTRAAGGAARAHIEEAPGGAIGSDSARAQAEATSGTARGRSGSGPHTDARDRAHTASTDRAPGAHPDATDRAPGAQPDAADSSAASGSTRPVQIGRPSGVTNTGTATTTLPDSNFCDEAEAEVDLGFTAAQLGMGMGATAEEAFGGGFGSAAPPLLRENVTISGVVSPDQYDYFQTCVAIHPTHHHREE